MKQIILFNKPYGVLCQFSGEAQDNTLADYIPLPDFYPAGRLDKNSEGLLILTNDGRLQHQLSHPRFHKRKHYWVQVEGIPSENDLQPLRNGLKHKDITFLPATVKRINEPLLWPRTPPIRYRASIPVTWIDIVLTEGKNHQIRKMTAAIGFPTLRLVRHQIGQWTLNDLKPGDYSLINIDPTRLKV